MHIFEWFWVLLIVFFVIWNSFLFRVLFLSSKTQNLSFAYRSSLCPIHLLPSAYRIHFYLDRIHVSVYLLQLRFCFNLVSPRVEHGLKCLHPSLYYAICNHSSFETLSKSSYPPDSGSRLFHFGIHGLSLGILLFHMCYVYWSVRVSFKLISVSARNIVFVLLRVIVHCH